MRKFLLWAAATYIMCGVTLFLCYKGLVMPSSVSAGLFFLCINQYNIELQKAKL